MGKCETGEEGKRVMGRRESVTGELGSSGRVLLPIPLFPCSPVSLLQRPVNFFPLGKFQLDFPFRVSQVKMRDGLRNREEPVNIISARKHLLRDFPGRRAGFRQKTYHLSLTILDRTEVTVEELLEVVYRLAMSPVHQRWRKRSQPRQAHEIFGERSKPLRRINRIGREDGVWSDALKHAIAGDYCAVGFAHKRARAWRVTRRVHDAKRTRFKLKLSIVVQLAVIADAELEFETG